MLRRLWFPLLLGPICLTATTYTCEPPPGTPLCQFPQKIDITFVGTPTSTNYDPFVDSWFQTWFKITVEESFTGLRPDEKEIVAWGSLGSGQPEIGRRFFVHAVRDKKDNRIYLASCGNTRPVEQAAQDIEYLRARQLGTFEPYVAGSVLRHYTQSQYAVDSQYPPRGLGAAHVTLRGPTGVLEAITDKEGQFRMAGVPPGTYALTAQSPGYRSLKTYTAVVPTGGCGIAHVGLFTNASMSGVVRRADGTPANDVQLDLIDVDPAFASPAVKNGPVKTNQNGEFSFSGLPSGRFLLGANIEETSRYPDQTPPTYYPGAARADAKVIEVRPNEAKNGLELSLLPSRQFRQVRVRLRWPDGSVPDRGAIDAWVNKGIYVSNYKLEEGIFDLHLLSGVSYWLTAAALNAQRHWIYADNYRLPAGEGTVEVVLIPRFPEPQWHKAVYSGASDK